jgi:hypothetical protein
MRPRSLALRLALAALVALAAADARAVRRTEDPIALVPADAATVAVLHWNELKKTPLGERVIANMEHVSGDDDARRFFQETGMTPAEDIDTVVVAMAPSGSGRSDSGLVLFEGRFDLTRIANALTSRGASLQKSAAGELYRLPGHGGEDGAVALVNRNLLVCGNEAAVQATLARRENGGEGGLGSGLGLGKQLSRVDRDASAWALVDLTRFARRDAAVSESGSSQPGSPEESQPARAVIGAMRSVSLLAIQATVHGDGLDFQATGVAGSADDRQNLEDALKGVLAMWRMAVQDKAPDLVSVIRKFQVDSDGDAVSIRGSLPGTFLRSLESRSAKK